MSFNYIDTYFTVPVRNRRSEIHVDTPELVKFTGSYRYDNKIPTKISPKRNTVLVRNKTKVKKILLPWSNKLYRKIHATLNLVNRFYEQVANEMVTKYPSIQPKLMPRITVHLVDRCTRTARGGTCDAYGIAFLKSNAIELKISEVHKLYQERPIQLENLILHELGHAIFGLRHCRRRGKRICPVMSRYGQSFQNNDKFKNRQRTRFKRFIKDTYKSQL